MEIVRFKKEHFSNLMLQDMQVAMGPILADPAYGEALEKQPIAFTAIEGDKVYACGGLVEEWQGVARAWMLITGQMDGKFIRVHRAVKSGLDKYTGFHRIEMSVAKGFTEGCRWAEMLGFKYEGLARKYTAGGHDCHKYARVT